MSQKFEHGEYVVWMETHGGGQADLYLYREDVCVFHKAYDWYELEIANHEFDELRRMLVHCEQERTA